MRRINLDHSRNATLQVPISAQRKNEVLIAIDLLTILKGIPCAVKKFRTHRRRCTLLPSSGPLFSGRNGSDPPFQPTGGYILLK